LNAIAACSGNWRCRSAGNPQQSKEIEMKPLKLVTAPVVDQLSRLADYGSNKTLRERADEHDQRRQIATLNVTALVGRFRKCEADEPGIYFGALECVLARYDVEIQKEAIRPGTWKFPPTDYELRERCEEISSEKAERAQLEQMRVAQLEERRRLDALEAERKPLLTYHARDSPSHVPRAEQERRQAEEFLARCKAEAEASARPADAPSVFELDPDNWEA
jgi:hypothetical protein